MNDTRSLDDPTTPLAGVKVVELGQMLAGPFAGMIFSDLGAEVLKVEKPTGGDDGRRMGPSHKGGDAMVFLEFNRGKKSVTLDLDDPGDRDRLHDLLDEADIFLHNMRPDVIEKFGLTYDDLADRHPRLVYCELSAFGHVGPRRNQPGFEPLVQAFSGLSSINGYPENPPVRVGPSVCDLGTGMWLAIGALAALRQRDLTGRGGRVSTSLFETALTWAMSPVDAWVNEDRVPRRYGTGQPNLVPYQTFAASDGDMMIAAGNDRLFGKLATVLGHPEWIDDDRFRGNRDRLAARDVIVGLVADVVRTRPRDEWLHELSAVGVPASPVNTIPEALEEAQFAALQNLQAVPGSDLSLLGLPISFGGEHPRILGAAPALGADNG
ncbi:CaiB/BaiF CoA transferase family protein [Herbiconiux ginsengi]|uniref:Formyl-CoA transferase n=1 Tax=Herbiconiux ginsengi TaxID=381665 RepID=A0A1H3TES3_9MICO|nr:CoA transferase [Herbiconiux ginsengi]SDZ48803.1 formyl-CoA transferase [Herbiconiux ginsengi]